MNLEDFGAMLKEKRCAKALSVRELKKMTGIPVSTIYKWEKTGIISPKEVHAKFLNTLGIDVKEFFTELTRLRANLAVDKIACCE